MHPAQLHYAKVLAGTGSFGEAAQACGVSQSTLADAISELEQELGAQLFRRGARQIQLTAFGRKIMGHVEYVLDAMQDLEQRAKALLDPKHKLLRIGYARIVDAARLQALCEPFKEAHPEVEFLLKEYPVSALETRLDNEQLDLICGIRLRDTPNRERRVLYDDVLHYLPRGGLGARHGMQIVSLKDAARETLVLADTSCGLTQLTRDLFHRTKTRFSEHPEHAANYQTLCEWSHAGIGAALLPASQIPEDVRIYPIIASNRGPVTVSYEAVWDKSASAPLHVKEFLKYLAATVGPLVKLGRPAEAHNRNTSAHAL
jgi:LysR family hydrogen peroxide-inducible transcriptional activator